ncbi:MAG: hypothetical protein K5761_03905 [Clostridiales bacterium]|nr:hypothetical protein [Clostridiales bacterium]
MTQIKKGRVNKKRILNTRSWLFWLVLLIVINVIFFSLIMVFMDSVYDDWFQILASIIGLASIGSFIGLILCISNKIKMKVETKYQKPDINVYFGKNDTHDSTNKYHNTYYYTYNHRVKGKLESKYSWGSIVLTYLIGLVPLGVFITLRKITDENEDYQKNGTYSLLFGVILTINNVLISIYFIAKGGLSYILVFPFVYLALGLSFLILGMAFKHKGKVYDKCLNLILNEKITDIDLLAKHMKLSYSQVCRIAYDLIENSFIEDAYIYHRDREIIVPGISNKIALKCDKCGSTSVMYSNEKHICDYCGEQL